MGNALEVWGKSCETATYSTGGCFSFVGFMLVICVILLYGIYSAISSSSSAQQQQKQNMYTAV